MGENETSTAARIDRQPTIGAGTATGHPMDAILQRIFKDLGVTVASELHWIRTEMEKRQAAAGGQPASAPERADDGLDGGDRNDGASRSESENDGEHDDAVVEAHPGAAGTEREAQEGHASNDTGIRSAFPVVRGRQAANRLVAPAEPAELFRTCTSLWLTFAATVATVN